jgi:hypothetical protein
MFMRLLVCGGRAYADENKVFGVLDILDRRSPITSVIQGGATGAEAIARDWAASRRIKIQTYIAGKKKTGQSSWTRGNQRMLDEGKPDLVVAFPGVRRTADMLRRAKAVGATVIEIER